MSATAVLVFAAIAAVADIVAILSWLKIEPSTLFNSSWTTREMRITAGRLAMVLLIGTIGLAFSSYGLYEIRTNESAAAMPRLLAWGIAGKHCNVVVDTSHIVDLADGYNIVLACGINDSTIDLLEDTRIILSGSFNISGGSQAMSAASTPDFDKVVSSLGDAPLSMWQKVFLVPKGLDLSNIHKVSDVPRLGGKLYK